MHSINDVIAAKKQNQTIAKQKQNRFERIELWGVVAVLVCLVPPVLLQIYECFGLLMAVDGSEESQSALVLAALEAAIYIALLMVIISVARWLLRLLNPYLSLHAVSADGITFIYGGIYLCDIERVISRFAGTDDVTRSDQLARAAGSSLAFGDSEAISRFLKEHHLDDDKIIGSFH